VNTLMLIDSANIYQIWP